MDRYKCVKASGAGNSFIIIWCETMPDKKFISYFWKSIEKFDTKPDGLILLMPPKSDGDIKMKVYNPDGCATAMCLNGIRCAARMAGEKLDLSKELRIETDSGIICVTDRGKHEFEVKGIESVHFLNYAMSDKCTKCINEISKEHIFTYVSVYTPYILTVVDKISERELEEVGIKANRLKQEFPIGINVSYVKKLDDKNLYVRTFERGGIGLSLSCSSSMVAASYMLVANGECPWDTEISVYNKGGKVNVSVQKGERGIIVNLTGDAIFEYCGELELCEEKGIFTLQKQKFFTERVENEAKIKQLKMSCKEREYLISK